ncbi:MAG: DNA-binding transcriptional regulator [Planctomycetota bacterium]|nr:MAG: DNA-binding transcriptional regulator [Planctomycetota bacterium]
MPKSRRIILLVETSRASGRGLLLGISRYSHLYGPWTFYRIPLYYRELYKRKETTSDLRDWGPDGIIMSDTFYPTKVRRSREIIKLGLPTIAIANEPNIPGVVNIIADNDRIGRMAAEHLLERGFRYFAYCGFDDIFWSVERGECFATRIREAGCETQLYKRPKSKFKHLWKNEELFMSNWLKSLPKPLGLMACNDDRGQQVIDACEVARLSVPDEVAIIAVDNDELVCGLTDPPLSSVNLNFERAGYQSAELLDKIMAGKKTSGQSILIPATHIATRLSTDILATKDRDVANALRFIRKHAKEPIRVSDVAEEATVSRRSLERHFRRVIGRSVHDQIRRVRIEQVVKMLLETNLTVSKIALSLGYPGVDHIAREFRREKGISPMAYRKQYGQK